MQEVVEPPNLDMLPILTTWPKDGGPFFTYAHVLTQDPETQRRNMGMYRLHKYDAQTTGIHWQIMKGGGYHYAKAEQLGRHLEVAVILGGDPTLTIASIAPLPEGVDELAFAGLLRGKPHAVCPAKTIGLAVPAEAEFVLEGVVPQKERRMEGPFGDHFGHYSLAAEFPVFHIKTVTHRRNPIYPASVVGKPPQEDMYIGNAINLMFRDIVKLLVPEVLDMWAYYEAGFHNLLVVQVRERYSKEAMKTAISLLGQGQLALSKFIVVVGPETSPRDFKAVMQAIAENFDPSEDFLLLPGVPLDTLDFTSFKMNLGSKCILSAVPKPGIKASARRMEESAPEPPELPSRVKRTRAIGGLLCVQAEKGERGLAEELAGHPLCGRYKIVAIVSEDVPLDDDVLLIWGVWTRFDAARDIVFTESRLRGAWPQHSGVMVIDATWKPGYPEPLEMDPAIVKLVDEKWKQYGI
jgi:4-hydroxy-3-polyprenylbenzoate decarboxylase